MNCDSPIALFTYLTNGACAIPYGNAVVPWHFADGEYIRLFAFNFLLEAPIYLLCLKFLLQTWLTPPKILFASLVANAATHPFICLLLPRLMNDQGYSYAAYNLAAETFAPIAEALILQFGFKLTPKAAWHASVAANLFSWLFGSWLAVQVGFFDK